MIIPDYIEPTIGWRTWIVAYDSGEVRLHSVSYPEQFWAPREPAIATCRKALQHPHLPDAEIPVEKCTCGLYSARDLGHLMSMRYHTYDLERNGTLNVIGTVANWGKVIPGTSGWRAQKSYPKKLYLPYEGWRMADALVETYGVEVELMNILKAN